MKKVFLLIILISAVTSNAFTQENRNSLQANVLYGSKIETVGFGLTYNLTGKKHEFSPSVSFYLPKNDVKAAEINFDYHRLYGIKDKIKIFPIIGFALSNWNGDYVEDKTKIGVNLGAGGRYDINDRFQAGFQFRYSAMSNSGSQSVPMLTIGYKL